MGPVAILVLVLVPGGRSFLVICKACFLRSIFLGGREGLCGQVGVGFFFLFSLSLALDSWVGGGENLLL